MVPSPNQIPIFEELVAPPRPASRPHLRVQPPLLADLTPRQRKAVTHGDGPLLIVAGAGTGKTAVITRRIAWLIATKRARPDEILALTFTDKAAGEAARDAEAAFEALVARHGPMVLGVCRRALADPEEIEDLTLLKLGTTPDRR